MFCITANYHDVFHFSDISNGQSVIRPENTCALIRKIETLDLNCSLKSELLQHWVIPDGTYISDNAEVLKDYKYKYSIVDSYNLRINHFTFADAGIYQCENDHYQYTAEVIAIGE